MAIGSLMRAIKHAVELSPGKTVHAHKHRGRGSFSSNRFLYPAFYRTLKAGLIKSSPGKKKGETIYFPVDK